MINLFSKSGILALLALSCAMSSSLIAWEDECDFCECNRLYVGAFGGVLFSGSSEMSQQGTALFDEASGGPLVVIAQGHTDKHTTGFGGVQLGYELAPFSTNSNWVIAPAVELETYFFRDKKRGDLINPTTRLPEHDFLDSFHLNTAVLFANALFSLNSFSFGDFTPYVGGGLGAARLSMRDADSLQVAPPEPGINHFNSQTHDSTWTFAAQAKIGLRYNISCNFHIFGEYRYLFVDASHYVLGATLDPAHAATTTWNVKINNIHYNAFAIGFQYDL